MTLEWNPGEPDVEGPEHIDVGYHHEALINSQGAAYGLRFEAKGGSTLDAVELYAGGGAQATLLDSRFGDLNRPMMLDLVEAGDEAMGTVQQDLIAPTSLVASSGMVSENFGTPVLADITGADDGQFLAAATLNAFVDLTFDTASFPLDRQILRVGFRFDANATTRVVKLDPPSNSVFSWYKDVPGLAPSPMPFYIFVGDAKWDNGDSNWGWWTPAAIREMAVGGGRKWRFQCRAGPGSWRLDFVRLAVIWVPERRVGVGVGSPTTPATWVMFDMATPAGTGNPTLVNGQDYTLVARQATPYSQDAHATNAVLPWRCLNGSTVQDAGETWDMHQLSMIIPSGVATAPVMLSGPIQMGSFRRDVAGIAACRMITGSGYRPETQPYALTRAGLIYDDQTLDQTVVVTDGALVYGQILAMVGRRNTLGRGTLRVEVLDSSAIRVLGVATLSILQWADAAWDSDGHFVTDDVSYTYKRVRFQFDTYTTLTPGTYTIRFSAPDTEREFAWAVSNLISNVTAGSNHTYGGSTETAEGIWPSGDEDRELTDSTYSSDAQVVLATVPPPVTGVGVAVGVVTAHHSDLPPAHSCFRSGCVDQGSPFARVTWELAPDENATYYQVQRTDPKVPGWQNVARVRGRATLSWDDHEVRMGHGIVSEYRLRSVRDDGVAGEWSESVAVEIPPVVPLAFTSNAASGMGCTYFEAWESRTISRTFEHQEFQDVEYHAFYGRNGQKAFHPIERRGVRFDRQVILSAMRQLQLPTVDASLALRNLAWAPLPYVCIRDGEGNRWFASIEVPTTENVRTEGSDRWYASVTVTEASTIPYNYDTGVEQVEPEDVSIE